MDVNILFDKLTGIEPITQQSAIDLQNEMFENPIVVKMKANKKHHALEELSQT